MRQSCAFKGSSVFSLSLFFAVVGESGESEELFVFLNGSFSRLKKEHTHSVVRRKPLDESAPEEPFYDAER